VSDAEAMNLSSSLLPPRFHKPFSCDLPTPRPEHLKQFKALYFKRFGIALTNEQALGQFMSLLAIVRYQQANKAWKEQFLTSRYNLNDHK